jgi:hypothetical protein
MGRIDRLSSPNESIRGVNFWPANDYEEYLNLKSRVENRMAAMTVIGTELDTQLTPELERMVRENPLLPNQAQKMLNQLQLTWDDVEDGEDVLGLDDLSLEGFRQEMFDFFKRKEDFFKSIPNGVYTGFKFRPSAKAAKMPDSLVAVLGYPRKPDEATDHVYSEIHLAHQVLDGGGNKTGILENRQEILGLLRRHKKEKRFVPRAVDNGDPAELEKIANALENWVTAQAKPVAINEIRDLFSGQLKPRAITPEQKKAEDKFQAGNFDLINWFIVSGK